MVKLNPEKKYKFAISIRSNHTGEEIILGSKHNSEKEAFAFAEKEVCARCQGISVFPVPEDSHWINKTVGFQRLEETSRLKENGSEDKTRRSRE